MDDQVRADIAELENKRLRLEREFWRTALLNGVAAVMTIAVTYLVALDEGGSEQLMLPWTLTIVLPVWWGVWAYRRHKSLSSELREILLEQNRVRHGTRE